MLFLALKKTDHINHSDTADANDQKWVIANVGKGEVLIMNNGTGKILEAIPSTSLPPCSSIIQPQHRVNMLRISTRAKRSFRLRSTICPELPLEAEFRCFLRTGQTSA